MPTALETAATALLLEGFDVVISACGVALTATSPAGAVTGVSFAEGYWRVTGDDPRYAVEKICCKL